MATSSSALQDDLTPAQRLMKQHEAAEIHHPTVEDVVDEDDVAHPAPSDAITPGAVVSDPPLANGSTMSAKAMGKQKAEVIPVQNNSASTATPRLDTQSEEAFPSLGPARAKAPTSTAWGSKPSFATQGIASSTSGRANGSTTNGALSGGSTPTITPSRAPVSQISLPGRYQEDMRMRSDQLRQDLRRPMPDLLKDINKKSKAKVEMSRANGFVTFRGTGPNQETVHQILKEVAVQLGEKQSIKVPIPASLRAQLIGKGGSTIKGIMESTGARIQIPKSTLGEEDDDDMVDIEIEGNPIAVVLARNAVESIVSQRTSTTNLRMKDIPPEFFPFIAGPRNTRIDSLVEGRDVHVKVPHYHTWQSQPPSAEHPSALTPQDGLHIQISGEREAARQLQAEIERQVSELRSQLALNQIPVEQARHQFISGDQGRDLHDFLEETGCAIIFPPPGTNTETLTIIGPADQIESAVNKAMDLASSMHMQSIDVARQHAGAGAGAQAHAQDLARYLQQRQAMAQFENQYNAQVVFPETTDGGPWQVFAREAKNAMRARTDIMNLVTGHPPARFRNVDVHPFYQRSLQNRYAQQLREQHGVHVIVPDGDDSQVLLILEDTNPTADYVLPRKQPSPSETRQYENTLREAEAALLSLIGEQQDVVSRRFEAPQKYREKIQRHLAREEQQNTADLYPIELLASQPQSSTTTSYPVEFRGPSSAVDEYERMIQAFVEEQIRDEAERGYTTTFDFPQKFANFLIGRKGENINKLRDDFDVDIQVNEGKVELKGPQAKADAAKAHILALGRKLEDETTHVLKIQPKFHREMIGAKGSQVLRLQERYGVRITFPRTGDDRATDETASDAGARRRQPQAPDEVIVKGPRKGADEARDELLSLNAYVQEISHTASVSVAASQIPSIIGQGGRELQNLREATGAEIDIPGRDEVDTSGRVEIKIKGKKAAVENAKKLLQEKAKVFDQSVSRSIEVDRQYHRALIGREGENVRQMIIAAGGSGDARELARMVQFPKADASDNAIRVEGQQDIVERIIEAIQSFVAVRDSQVTETIEVPPEKHGALIGRRGETRKGIESDYNVTIMIPSTTTTGPARSQIKVTGMAEDVQKAKGRISGMVKSQEGETIHIPIRLHHAVADTNGNIFQSLKRDHRVTVDHAGQNRPPRPEVPRPTFSSSAGASTSNLPLITDDTSAASNASANVQDEHFWEMLGSVPAASTGGDDPTIPWILRGGDANAVARARAQIEAALAGAEQNVTGYLVLPDPKTYRFVIGQGGSTVNSIRHTTGCKIDVPKAGGSKDAIEITGPRNQVEEAKEMVLEAVAQGLSRR